MKLLLKELWQRDRKSCLTIIFLQIATSLMGGIGIVMMIPMLELLDISAGSTGWLGSLMGLMADVPLALRAIAIVGIYIGLLLMKSLLGRSLTIRQTAFVEGYALMLRNRLYDSVSAAGWEQLASRKQADTINLFTVQCSQVSSAVSSTISMLSSLVTASIQIAIACWMSLPITMLICVVGFILMGIFLPLRRRSRKFGDEMIRISRDFYGELFNQLNSVKEMRTYGVEEAHAEHYSTLSRAFVDAQVKFAHVRSMPNVVFSVAAALLISLVFILSIAVLDIETARLMVMVLIFSKLWPVFSSWQGMILNIQTCVPALEKLNRTIADLDASASEQLGTEEITFEEKIVFEDVAFAYTTSDDSVLKNINLTLQHGKITALVGRSGAGKSTIADLLMGFLHPGSGRICVDGVPLTSENIRAWRKYIGYIPQHPLIINASVRENLSRFHPEATEEQMIEALKKAVAWDFVEKLPRGLDTVLGDQGVRLSGGERQRIVLARVLLGNPKVIILDEATSALDYESENAVRDVLHTMRSDAAILVIAHRLATVLIADEAIVLEHGSITETGTVSDLAKHSGGYLAGMVNM